MEPVYEPVHRSVEWCKKSGRYRTVGAGIYR